MSNPPPPQPRQSSSVASMPLAAAATIANATLAGLLFNHVTVTASDSSAVVFCLVSGTLSVLVAWYIVRAWRASRAASKGAGRGGRLVVALLALFVDVAVFVFAASVGLLTLIGPMGR